MLSIRIDSIGGGCEVHGVPFLEGGFYSLRDKAQDTGGGRVQVEAGS